MVRNALKIIIILMISLLATACECEFPFSSTIGLSSVYDQSSSTVDIVCLYGDSNAAGIGLAADHINSVTAALAGNSYTYDGTGGGSQWEAITPGTNTDGLPNGTAGKFGLETPLAAFYYETFNKPLYFVKIGFGGYTIDSAAGQSFHPSADPTGYLNLVNPLTAAIAESTGLPAAITTYRLHLIWMIGANDANNGTYASNYGTNMSTLFTQMETDIGESFTTVTDVKLSTQFNLVDVSSVNTAKTSFISGLGSRGTLIDPGSAQTEQVTHWTGLGVIDIAQQVFISIFYE